MKRLAILLLLSICIGCHEKPDNPPVHIVLTNNNNSLKVIGISGLILKEIAADSSNRWQSLFVIYKMPADTELKNYQPLQPGRYELKDSSITYTPDTPFAKQQGYFLRYYRYGDNNSIWDFIKGKKSPGKLAYTDLIFKP